MADINVTADPCEVIVTGQHGLLTWTPYVRNPALDQTFDLGIINTKGEQPGIGVITITVLGTWLNNKFSKGIWHGEEFLENPTPEQEAIGIRNGIILLTVTILGEWLSGFSINASPCIITIGTKDIDLLLEKLKKNWVKWSKIGHLDFTIGKDNIAGERPMDWDGWVYAMKKLGNKVVAYGENGVSILPPAGNTYGLDTIYRIGLKGKNAVCGTESVHFFVDNRGQLFQLSDSLVKLDYSEYLSALTSNIVMSYDLRNNLLYICDGTVGYVYRDGSLGKGPANLTGINTKDNIFYAVAPTPVVVAPFEICTDVFDFGNRKGKTINSIEVGTDLTQTLKASIDYRMDKAQAFSQTGWYDIDKRGMAFINAYGAEFKFRVKTTTYNYFELDWLKVNGYIPTYN